MKIEYALHSCNSNPVYLDYWPIISAAWRRLGIEPVLFYIQDDPDIIPSSEHGIVHILQPVSDIDIVIQATWARMWGATRYLDSIVLVSDIDMIPLSRKYFVDLVAPIDDSIYVYLINEHYLDNVSIRIEELGRIRICYQIGKGCRIREMLELSDDWEENLHTLVPYYSPKLIPLRNPVSAHVSEKFCLRQSDGDELYITKKIKKNYDHKKVCLLNANAVRHDLSGTLRTSAILNEVRLIGRENILFYDVELLKSGYYLDFHAQDSYLIAQEMINVILAQQPIPAKYRQIAAPLVKWCQFHYLLIQYIPFTYLCVTVWFFLFLRRTARRGDAVMVKKNGMSLYISYTRKIMLYNSYYRKIKYIFMIIFMMERFVKVAIKKFLSIY